MTVNHINQIDGRTVEQQMRLRLQTDKGPLDLVPIGRDDIGAMRWSWPGRVSVTYGEVVRLCRARGWPRPELMPARIVRRAETEEDDHGQ